ncbi:MAG: hypothetical protein M1537_08445 [Nitrospirae bacterium]|nr:hypothetical protein [Nitrospirota bacterium]
MKELEGKGGPNGAGPDSFPRRLMLPVFWGYDRDRSLEELIHPIPSEVSDVQIVIYQMMMDFTELIFNASMWIKGQKKGRKPSLGFEDTSRWPTTSRTLT